MAWLCSFLQCKSRIYYKVYKKENNAGEGKSFDTPKGTKIICLFKM